ncbi:PTS sugar transporter subunit IIB [Olsenella porci]|jgi:PTS system ascorbate-specific IIB component|uniref:PTS ascorbate transporter subunit IIB n=1 Tax=Olsenella porci TaxID=2652279 RepID=A0A6N7X8M8_9ACTN|nr:PTS ascorbate transporter subunit IIB [Olsenella porci]MCI1997074.1 PTS ascorbate transporter subunit IIB [Olsenella sp.]MST71892.1 PTS ascorbate transporter subunit IIB [Olsenella porci]
MAEKYKALVCCRAGVAMSQILDVNVNQVLAEEGYPIQTERGTIDDIKGFDGDLVITMSDMAIDLQGKEGLPYVVGIRNVVDKPEIKAGLVAFLKSKGEDVAE